MKIINNTYIDKLIEQEKDRYTKKQIMQIDELRETETKTYQLKKIKKHQGIIKVGDVFIYRTKDNPDVYYYGKVLYLNNCVLKFGDDKLDYYFVYLFTCRTNNPTIDDYIPDYNSSIFTPLNILDSYFELGLLKIVGNIPLTNFEKNMDIGYYSGVDFNGNISLREHAFVAKSGIAMIFEISHQLHKRIIEQPSITDVDKQVEDKKYNIYNILDVDDTYLSSIKYLNIYFKHFIKYKKEKIYMQELEYIRNVKERNNVINTDEILEGSIFIVKPYEDKEIYFYGKVIKHFKDVGVFENGNISMCLLFENNTDGINLKSYNPNYDNLLIMPVAINDINFNNTFKIIGYESINEFDLNFNIGCFGQSINMNEKYFSDYNNKTKFKVGLSLDYGVILEIRRRIIKDKYLLKLNKKAIFKKINIVKYIKQHIDLVNKQED